MTLPSPPVLQNCRCILPWQSELRAALEKAVGNTEPLLPEWRMVKK